MSLDLRRVIFERYRTPIFIAATFVTSSLALRPDSTLVPNILNLSVLYTYAPFLFRSDEPYRVWKVLGTGVALTAGSALSRTHASLEALSSPAQSLITLFILSSFLSALALGATFAGVKLSTRFPSTWSQIALFPSIWATLWATTSYISPVGHLSTWGVANNADSYNWLIPYLGPASKDWVIGAWAVVLSQTLTHWYMGFEEPDQIPNLTLPARSNNPVDHSMSATRKLLALVLVLLTVPSFSSSPLPLPISQIEAATPITVGCVNPPYQQHKHHNPTLDDYISETNKLRNWGGRILLWPEGAVVFNTPKEKEDAFTKIREQVTGPYVGVSFEETISDPADPSGRKSVTRAGLAVISKYLDEPHLIYYKRHLVPFAESYRLRGSSPHPTIFEAPLKSPGRGITDHQWSPDGNHTRPIPMTASICLDFASASPFAELDSRPALILAPARTWDRTVGYAMWLQAKQRAEEIGSTVLWCDGGEGGVSGVGGGGFNDVTQVGSGSFLKTIGIKYPFDNRRTPYARFGDSVLVLVWALVLGPGVLGFISPRLPFFQRGVHGARGLLKRRNSTPSPVIAQANLIDV
ncbi:hypothetical protein CPB83DRAFT_814927 [Crepidotus variabilis]|uniref:CN hydrolase domain-containing protein n=1 Tax=Crepidotus variabilis TaxID=179855 RepID=A0A9P6EES9_9AGAR|nr:hypothetical protein CPB83DRAFT_814927 [Crepidotus variabilis]